jgi:hypothetical protein
MSRSPVAAVVRGWVDLYTRGLPADLRAARRDEVDDDRELGRVGVLSKRLSRAHLAAAVIWVVPIAAILANSTILADTSMAVALLALALPYGFTGSRSVGRSDMGRSCLTDRQKDGIPRASSRC